MDITPYIGTIITVVIAVGGFYIAIVSRLTRLETLIENQMKATEKHNSIIERTYKLESDVHTAFKRIDELKEVDNRLDDKIDKLKMKDGEQHA